MQNSDSGSMTFCSKAGTSSQRTSPFREIVGYATEQLSSSSLCSSPDDASCDGIKLEETEAWQLRLAYSTSWPGMALAICPYLDRYFLASAGNAVSDSILYLYIYMLSSCQNELSYHPRAVAYEKKKSPCFSFMYVDFQMKIPRGLGSLLLEGHVL